MLYVCMYAEKEHIYFLFFINTESIKRFKKIDDGNQEQQINQHNSSSKANKKTK